jgi:hypothetical protein
MPLPSSINDLSQTAGSNSPAGSESPSTIDDYLRVYASYIALLRDLTRASLVFASVNTTWTSANLGYCVVVSVAGTTQTLPPVASSPSGSTMTFAAYGATTIKGNASETIANIYGSAASNTITIGAAEQIRLVSNGSVWCIESYVQANAAAPISATANAKMSVAAASASATFTADEVVVGTALGGQTYRLTSYSKVINLATTGAGGMDAGAAPVSGYVALYAIFNPLTGASSILATNATLAVMPPVYNAAPYPAGYTASALLTVVPTNASSQFPILDVLDRFVKIQLVTVLNIVANRANAPLSISSAIPPNAKEISGELELISSTASNLNISISGVNSNGAQGLGMPVPAGGDIIGSYYGVPVTTPQIINAAASTSGAGPNFKIYVGGYRI